MRYTIIWQRLAEQFDKEMNSQNVTLPAPSGQKGADTSNHTPQTPNSLPPMCGKLFGVLSPFWQDRLVEAGLILSMGLYYVVGNEHLGTSRLFHLNPLYSLPFLLIFAGLCWYRLSFAVALLPLALPYYLLQKTVVGHYSFSLVEIALGVCLAVAVVQFVVRRGRWRYRLAWRELRDRLGPFAIPILLFLLMAAFSVVIAYDHRIALRAFRQEVLDPILYLLLALFCLRSRKDVVRLLGALIATGLFVALVGMAQYLFFRNQLVPEAGVRRIDAMYGSANSIGLFFDYILPICMAMVLVGVRQAPGTLRVWGLRVFAAVLCLPLLLVLYLSESRGAWLAIAVASLFILAVSIGKRKVLLIGGLLFVGVMVVVFVLFRRPILEFIVGGHESVKGVSTLTKRIYLWESALRMIHDRPWFGFGMENWLCYYSYNTVCHIPAKIQPFHYWILTNPVTKVPTGLADEPTLSHPHNIFLHVWVSMGVFGLLAFVAVLVLFFWLFVRILMKLRLSEVEGSVHVQWMTMGVGAALLAALVQGLVDSSFLVQDLAFCFWMLVAALLVLRVASGTSWRERPTP